jgi:hypothetical protein
MMFYLVDKCGKELADCLEKATYKGKEFWVWTFNHIHFLKRSMF